MKTKAFQKIYTKIENITKATVMVRAEGIGNDEMAYVADRPAQVVKIAGDRVTLQVFPRTQGIANNAEVVFMGEGIELQHMDALSLRWLCRPQGFIDLFPNLQTFRVVVADEAVGGIQDGLGGAVVGVEHHSG